MSAVYRAASVAINEHINEKQLKRKALPLFLSLCTSGLLSAADIKESSIQSIPPQHIQDQNYSFNIKSQSMEQALLAYADQSGVQILFDTKAMAGLTSHDVVGELNREQAIQRLLGGVKLEYRFTAKNTLVVKPVSKNAKGVRGQVKKNLLAATVAFFSGVGGVQQAVAQDGGAENSGFVLEEIVVTATKRDTSLQDTAMAISVLGKDTINKRNLVGMGDYLNSLPGVTALDQGSGFNSIVIRGIAVSPQTEGINTSPASGVYFGETAISGFGILGNTSDIKLVDMERVEVLRGPQGTLYGAGAMGGVVRNIPSPPNLESVEGKLQAGYSSTAEEGGNNNNIKGVLNIPLIEDTLAIRAVAYRFDDSGYYKNISGSDPAAALSGAVTNYSAVVLDQDDIGQTEVTGGRISLLWQPTEQLSVNLSYLDQEVEQEGRPQADFDLPAGFSQSRFAVRENSSGAPDQPESLTDNIEITNLTINYDIGWGNITSSSSWINQVSENIFDASVFTGDTIALNSNVGYLGDFFSQEIRLASQFDGPWQVLFGIYYEERNIDNTNNAMFSGSDSSLTDGLFGLGPGVISIFHNATRRELDQQALFGELSYDIVDNLKLTIGARVFDYDRTITERDFPDTGRPTFGLTPIVSDSSEKDTSFKTSLEYTLSDSTLLYATWSEGFRVGYPVPAISPARAASCDRDGNGFYDGSNGISVDTRSIDNDYVDNFELGSKFTLLENRLTLNAALYQIDWGGIPVSTAFDWCSAIVNAGEATSRGIELELSYRWTENLLLSISSSYVNAKLTEDNPAINASKGDRLPGSADVNASVGIEYQFTVAGYDAYLRSDYTYVGGFYNNLQEMGTEAGDYSKLNVKTGIAINDFTVDLYIDNLTNDDGITWVDTQLRDNRGNRLRPRAMGLNVGYHF